MKKKVLMVAFEFPPCNGASVQRIFSVYKGFIEHGYDVDVVTAKPHAYAKTSNDLFETIPSEQLSRIHRTMALDAQRHLSIKGKHIGVTATPDRWAITWVPSASVNVIVVASVGTPVNKNSALPVGQTIGFNIPVGFSA